MRAEWRNNAQKRLSWPVWLARDVVIPRQEILAQTIPMDGPWIGTIVYQRDIMSDGLVQVAETVTEAEPAVVVALLDALTKGTNRSGWAFTVTSRTHFPCGCVTDSN